MLRSFSVAGVLACMSPHANAHEFWIDPEAHILPSDGEIVASLRVGELYEGISYAYLPPRFKRFDFVFRGETSPVEGQIGDRPALTMAAPGDGLVTLVHVTSNSSITWDDFSSFVSFVEHKDAAWAIAAHRERGLAEEDVTEVYSRYAKSLIGVGSAEGSDMVAGLLTEIVALENPYTDDTRDGVDVRLLYQDEPRQEEQIEVFALSPGGDVVVSTVRTDNDGVATIPVEPGYRYMLDAVVLRDGGDMAQWESLWANLTFEVPGT